MLGVRCSGCSRKTWQASRGSGRGPQTGARSAVLRHGGEPPPRQWRRVDGHCPVSRFQVARRHDAEGEGWYGWRSGDNAAGMGEVTGSHSPDPRTEIEDAAGAVLLGLIVETRYDSRQMRSRSRPRNGIRTRWRLVRLLGRAPGERGGGSQFGTAVKFRAHGIRVYTHRRARMATGDKIVLTVNRSEPASTVLESSQLDPKSHRQHTHTRAQPPTRSKISTMPRNLRAQVHRREVCVARASLRLRQWVSASAAVCRAGSGAERRGFQASPHTMGHAAPLHQLAPLLLWGLSRAWRLCMPARRKSGTRGCMLFFDAFAPVKIQNNPNWSNGRQAPCCARDGRMQLTTVTPAVALRALLV